LDLRDHESSVEKSDLWLFLLHSVEGAEWRFNGQESTESFPGLRVVALSNVRSAMSPLETGSMLYLDVL